MSVRRGTELALGLAMAVAAVLILHATDGQGFAVDELYYYGRVAVKEGVLFHYPSQFSPQYLLAPFNGHLALGGRFVYESVFATIGAHYTAFVVINILGICACAGLVFVLARRRVGDLAALAPCLLILFLGAAREQFLWPLDFNSSVALAAGLGAILCLQREDRRGDLLACLLLALSAAMIEVGLAFLVGAAVAIAMRPDRFRRAWIVVAPVVFYAAWWIWSARFGQGETELANLSGVPKMVFDSIAVVLGSLSGTGPIHPESFGTEVTGLGRILAAVALVGLVVRLLRGSLPRTIWIWIAVAASYWTLLAIADRPPQSGRYLLVGTVLVILIAADCFRRPLSNRAGAALVVLALLTLPHNFDGLLSGRDQNVLRTDIPTSRAEFAMLELAHDRVDPAYVVSSDLRVVEAGGGLYLGIPAGAYLDSARQNGSIAFTPEELRRQPEKVRRVADAALMGALRLELIPAVRPAGATDCRRAAPAPKRRAALPLDGRSQYLLMRGNRTALIGLRRLATWGPGAALARLRPGGWTKLEVPSTPAPEPWQVVADAPIVVCSLSSGAS
jgi:hypothetical protein